MNELQLVQYTDNGRLQWDVYVGRGKQETAYRQVTLSSAARVKRLIENQPNNIGYFRHDEDIWEATIS